MNKAGILILALAGFLFLSVVTYLIALGNSPITPLEIRLFGIFWVALTALGVFSQFIIFNAVVTNSRMVNLLTREISKFNTSLGKVVGQFNTLITKLSTRMASLEASTDNQTTVVDAFLALMKRKKDG